MDEVCSDIPLRHRKQTGRLVMKTDYVRLFNLIKIYNVGQKELTEILREKGYEVEDDPHAKLPLSTVEFLDGYFGKSPSIIVPKEEVLPHDSSVLNKPVVGKYYHTVPFGKKVLLMGVVNEYGQTSFTSLEAMINALITKRITGNTDFDYQSDRLIKTISAFKGMAIEDVEIRGAIEDFAYYAVDVYQLQKNSFYKEQIIATISMPELQPDVIVSIVPYETEFDPFDILAIDPLVINAVLGGCFYLKQINISEDYQPVVVKLHTDNISNKDLVSYLNITAPHKTIDKVLPRKELERVLKPFEDAGYIKNQGDGRYFWLKTAGQKRFFAFWLMELCHFLGLDRKASGSNGTSKITLTLFKGIIIYEPEPTWFPARQNLTGARKKIFKSYEYNDYENMKDKPYLDAYDEYRHKGCIEEQYEAIIELFDRL